MKGERGYVRHNELCFMQIVLLEDIFCSRLGDWNRDTKFDVNKNYPIYRVGQLTSSRIDGDDFRHQIAEASYLFLLFRIGRK